MLSTIFYWIILPAFFAFFFGFLANVLKTMASKTS